jgi:hypothetical protein
VTRGEAEARFVASLRDAAPPPGLTPALRGLWHALRGEWEPAHDAVQPDDRDCAWVHAALHRDEGDLPNARYWYAEARRPVATGAAPDEYRAILRELLAAR